MTRAVTVRHTPNQISRTKGAEFIAMRERLREFDTYSHTRGFIFDNPLEYMPGPHMYTFNDLLDFLADVARQDDHFKEARHSVRQKAISTSTCYCESLAQILLPEASLKK